MSNHYQPFILLFAVYFCYHIYQQDLCQVSQILKWLQVFILIISFFCLLLPQPAILFSAMLLIIPWLCLKHTYKFLLLEKCLPFFNAKYKQQLKYFQRPFSIEVWVVSAHNLLLFHLRILPQQISLDFQFEFLNWID